ncbi:MAG: hypothetical protein ACLQJR_23080 [Stellaceae bacterium]
MALHPARGAALIALLEAGEEASPEEAHAAFRAMLEESGFNQRFPGELPVVALAARRAESDELAAAVERSFDALPRLTLAEDWVDWLAERLAPADAEPSVPRLVAPARDAPEAPSEAPPAPQPERRDSWTDWGASLGFAVGIVLAGLIGLAFLSHTGRLF